MSHRHTERIIMRPFTAATVAASAILIGVAGVSAAPVLQLDINDRRSDVVDLTQSGFTPFLLDGADGSSQTTVTRTNLGGTDIDVTVTVVDTDAPPDNTNGAMDDRIRSGPTNSGAFTFEEIYRDFIFVGGSAGLTGGLDIDVSDLLPNTPYTVTIYSFDTVSNGLRTADYTANGTFLLTTAFDGTADDATGSLASNDQFAFTGIATTDAAGDLLISGRATSETIPAVYLNAIEFEVIPEPASLGLLSVGGLLALRRKRARAGH